MNHPSFVKRNVFLGLLTAGSLLSAKALALSIKMQESSSPPKGVSGRVEESKTPAAPAATGGAGEAPAPAGGGAPQGQQAGKDPYQGIFNIWQPLDKVLPLKSGKITAAFMSLGNNPGGGAAALLRDNSIGGYFLEAGGKDYGLLKGLTGKFQYNRQLKTSLNANRMMEWKASVLGAELRFNRTDNRTGSAGVTNLQNSNTYGLNYQSKKGLAVAYQSTVNIAKTLGASPARSGARNQSLNLTLPLTKKIKLTHVGNTASSRNYFSGDITRAVQTDTRLDVPFRKNLSFIMGYQGQVNRNLPANGQGNQRSGRFTRYTGITYSFMKDMKLTFKVDRNHSKNSSPGQTTSFDTTKKDWLLEAPLSSKAKFKATLQSVFDLSTGMTRVGATNFSYDHKKLRLLPGSTTVDTRREFVRAGTNSTYNTTTVLNTPLAYLKDKLKVNLQETFTNQKNLTGNENTEGNNATYSLDYLFNKIFSVGTSYNQVRSSNFKNSVLSAKSNNKVHTNKASLKFKSLFGLKPKGMENLQYTYAMTDNKTVTQFPAVSGNGVYAPKHALAFLFKGKTWTGNYTIDRSQAIPSLGERQRSFQHNFNWTFQDLFGFQLTANYVGAFQKTGKQATGVFRLTKKQGEKKSLFLNYEFLKNGNNSTPAQSSKNRYMEAGWELSF